MGWLEIAFGAYWFLAIFGYSIKETPSGGFWDNYEVASQIGAQFKNFVFAIVLIWTGIGLLHLKNWARKMNLIFMPIFFWYIFYSTVVHAFGGIRDAGMTFAESIFAYFHKEFINLQSLWAIKGLLIHLLIFTPVFFYLTRPKVKEQFVKQDGASSND